MAEDQSTPAPDFPAKRGAQFRITAIVLLLAGFISAGLVYAFGTRPEKLPDEMTSDYKIAARARTSNFGQMGAFSDSLDDDFKDPTIQAGLIAIVSIVVAAGFFLLAELQKHPPQSKDPPV